jgi:hypothetical protein
MFWSTPPELRATARGCSIRKPLPENIIVEFSLDRITPPEERKGVFDYGPKGHLSLIVGVECLCLLATKAASLEGRTFLLRVCERIQQLKGVDLPADALISQQPPPPLTLSAI